MKICNNGDLTTWNKRKNGRRRKLKGLDSKKHGSFGGDIVQQEIYKEREISWRNLAKI